MSKRNQGKTPAQGAVTRVPVASVLPDPHNLREEIDWEHIAENIAPDMERNGFRTSKSIEVRKIPVARYKELLKTSPRLSDPQWMKNVQVDFLPQSGDVWMVVDGEHRLHAAIQTGTDPYVVDVGELSESEVLAQQFAGNTGKPWPMSAGYLMVKRLHESQGLDASEIKELLRRNINWIEPRMAAAWLPEEVLKLAGNGRLRVADLSALASLKNTVGSRNVKTLDDAKLIANDIVSRWEAARAEERNFDVLAAVAEHTQDADQAFAFGGAALPDPERVIERRFGARVSKFTDTVARLSSEMQQALRAWQDKHPNASEEEERRFFERISAQGHGTIKTLLGTLNLASKDMRALVCKLCALGYTAEACTLCAAGEEKTMAKKTTRKKTTKKATRKKAAKKTTRKKAAKKSTRKKAAKKSTRKKSTRKKAAKKSTRKKSTRKKPAPRKPVTELGTLLYIGKLIEFQVWNPTTCTLSTRKAPKGQPHLAYSKKAKLVTIAAMRAGGTDLPESVPDKGKEKVASITYMHQGTRYTHAFAKRPEFAKGGKASVILNVEYSAARGFTG